MKSKSAKAEGENKMKCKIVIHQKTKEELRKYGVKDSTWDQIVKDLLRHAETCDSYWNSK